MAVMEDGGELVYVEGDELGRNVLRMVVVAKPERFLLFKNTIFVCCSDYPLLKFWISLHQTVVKAYRHANVGTFSTLRQRHSQRASVNFENAANREERTHGSAMQKELSIIN